MPCCATPISKRDQLFGEPAPLKATVDFHPVVVREKQELALGCCAEQRVPTKVKGKGYHLGEVISLASFELMPWRVIEPALLTMCSSP